MPSLHLNLGKSYEDTGDFERAAASYRDAEASLDVLEEDGYGTLVRRGVTAALERTAAWSQNDL